MPYPCLCPQHLADNKRMDSRHEAHGHITQRHAYSPNTEQGWLSGKAKRHNIGFSDIRKPHPKAA